jgi:quaternary ammonium compound-resistance protein SugE
MTTTAWIVLAVAGLFEATWAIGLEYSEGLSRPVPTALTAIAIVISMVLLAWSLRELPVGTAYAVWTGIGATLTALLGIVLFDESTALARLAFIGVVVVGLVGLHLTSG